VSISAVPPWSSDVYLFNLHAIFNFYAEYLALTANDAHISHRRCTIEIELQKFVCPSRAAGKWIANIYIVEIADFGGLFTSSRQCHKEQSSFQQDANAQGAEKKGS